MELEVIKGRIFEIRGIQVMLDSDLASLYGVDTKVLNQAVKRNLKRFPSDFMFQITTEEWSILKSQFVTSSIDGLIYPPGLYSYYIMSFHFQLN